MRHSHKARSRLFLRVKSGSQLLVVGIQFLIERSAFGDEARSIVERLDRSRNVDQHALALHIGRLALHSHVELFESLLRRGDFREIEKFPRYLSVLSQIRSKIAGKAPVEEVRALQVGGVRI